MRLTFRHGVLMMKKIPLISVVFLALALLAFYLMTKPYNRGGAMIVLLFAFILFWRRSLRSS
jgi:hypothetical protein